MKIISGLFENMVVQRSRQNLSRVRFTGECGHDGTLLACVNNGSTEKVGICKSGLLHGVLAGLKTGGPYKIELFIKNRHGKIFEKIKFRNVLVGDVWILGGQSNMEGMGHLKYASKPQGKVRAFYMDDRWDIAKDPIHNITKAVDQVHSDLSGGKPPARALHTGVGPGVAFGQEMLRSTGIPQGLISCAHGGTSMTHWDPALKSKGGKSLYGAMLRRFHKNGGRVAGVVWYQGCSDASREHIHYTHRMILMINAMRSDFGDHRLPVTIVQIAGACTSGSSKLWNNIQEQQRILSEKIGNFAVVPAIDLSFDDTVHISGFDQNRLGKRLAQAMCVLRHEKNAGLPPIELHSITEGFEKKTGERTVSIKFRNVMGHLQSFGKPCGFSVVDANKVSPCLFRTDLEKDRAILRLPFQLTPWSPSIHYGYGFAPYCNITDSGDRSLPVFGPATIGRKYFGDFIVDWLVSRAMPSAGNLNNLIYPKNKNSARFRPRFFSAGPFCDLHLDLFKCWPKDFLVYFANRVFCSEPMKLELCLGYDGPVKAWIDGEQVFHDPKGTNPAYPDKGTIPWEARKGNHELIIALGANNGKAWGIFARFRRRDVSSNLFKPGVDYCILPVCQS